MSGGTSWLVIVFFNLCLCRIGCCTDQKGRLLQGWAVVTWSSDTSDVLLFMNLQFLWGYELFFLMRQPVIYLFSVRGLFCQAHTIPDGLAVWCKLPAFFSKVCYTSRIFLAYLENTMHLPWFLIQVSSWNQGMITINCQTLGWCKTVGGLWSVALESFSQGVKAIAPSLSHAN